MDKHIRETQTTHDWKMLQNRRLHKSITNTNTDAHKTETDQLQLWNIAYCYNYNRLRVAFMMPSDFC